MQTIDAISTDERSNAVQLTIFDAWDWIDEGKHLLALQDKINVYFGFLQSGQLLQNYPNAAEKAVLISILAKHPASECIELVGRADILAKKWAQALPILNCRPSRS